MKTARILPAAAALLAALLSPSSFADNADVRFSIGDVSVGIGIGTPPPASIIEYVPVAMPGHVWMPGYWAWNGHQHVWNRGAWERERLGYRHVAGHWEQRNHHWHFEPSRWEAREIAGHHRERRVHKQHAWYEKRRDHSR